METTNSFLKFSSYAVHIYKLDYLLLQRHSCTIIGRKILEGLRNYNVRLLLMKQL